MNYLIGKLMCWVGLHEWQWDGEWNPEPEWRCAHCPAAEPVTRITPWL